MKILFPCPGCRHPLVLPQHASSLARLQCSVCSHKLTAESIFLDASRLGSEWEVIDDAGTDDVFGALYHAASLRNLDTSLVNGQVLREPTVVVPPSNEWETQPSSLLIDESHETDKEYQIVNEFQASEVGNRGETPDYQNDSMPDQMIGVSDEPWFSPTDQPLDSMDESEIAVSDQPTPESVTEFEAESESEVSLATEGWGDDLQEVDEEPVLTLDDLDEFEPIEELEEVSTSQAEPVVQTAEARPRATQTLPVELLGNSSSVLRSRKKSNSFGTLLSVIGGGVAAIPISILLMWYALGKDPLSAGPMVASIAPWIVPEKFQGSSSGKAEVLPEMPPMVGPGFSDMASGGPMKLPGIGGESTTEPATQPASEPVTEPLPAELAMKPADEPTLPIEPVPDTPVTSTESSTPLAMAPSIDTAIVPPSIPEMPKLGSTPDVKVSDVSTETPTASLPPSVGSNDISSLANPEPTVSKIEQSILNLKKSIEVFDAGAYESGAILFRALEKYGEQLASLPESSPERDEWRSKGLEAVEKIAGSAEMLKSFRNFMTKSQGTTELFPGESLQSREPTITIDFVQVGSIKNGDNHDVWAISKLTRFQTNLEDRPIVVPHNLNVSASPKSAFLVLGISEVDPDSRENVLRAFIAVQKK